MNETASICIIIYFLKKHKIKLNKFLFKRILIESDLIFRVPIEIIAYIVRSKEDIYSGCIRTGNKKAINELLSNYFTPSLENTPINLYDKLQRGLKKN